jgi:hypothetical protein
LHTLNHAVFHDFFFLNYICSIKRLYTKAQYKWIRRFLRCSF